MKSRLAILCTALVQGIMPATLDAALGSNELAAARSQSTNSLATFKGFITPANAGPLGFGSLLEVLSATNAEPLLIYTIPLSRLINYQLTNDFTSLLYPDPQSDPAPVTRVVVPVMAGANVRSSISLRLVPTPVNAPVRWTNAGWGSPKLIQDLVQVAQAIPPAQRAPTRDPFVVEIPVFDVWLVGYYNNDNPSKLILLSTADMRFGLTVISRYQVITPEAMYQMRLAAHRYNGLAN